MDRHALRFREGLDEDGQLALTAAAEADDQIVFRGAEMSERRFAATDDAEGPLDDIRLDAAAADGTPRLPVAAHEQSRTGAPVGGAFGLDHRGQGAIATARGAALLEDAQKLHAYSLPPARRESMSFMME
jgi:hypothetical protein